MIRHFYIGTTNSHKVREIGSILSATTGFTYSCTDPIDPDETEPDFEGNALLKARVYAGHSHGVTISEDSGIMIPALGGLPGPWSARFSDYAQVDTKRGVLGKYCPSGRSREEIDRTNNERVLELMQGMQQPYRTALFIVVLAVADPNGNILFKSVGTSSGWIANEMRGTNGFGYDPIFIGNDTFGNTYAELDSMRKNMRSHRRKVLQDFKAYLASVLKQSET